MPLRIIGKQTSPTASFLYRQLQIMPHKRFKLYYLYHALTPVQLSSQFPWRAPAQFSSIIPGVGRGCHRGWRGYLHEGNGATPEETHLWKGPLGRCNRRVQRNWEENFQRLKHTSGGANKVSFNTWRCLKLSWLPRRLGFPTSGKESRTLPYAHVLDLADWGHIKPHIDSSRVRFRSVRNLWLWTAS